MHTGGAILSENPTHSHLSFKQGSAVDHEVKTSLYNTT